MQTVTHARGIFSNEAARKAPIGALALLKQSGGETWPISLYIMAMATIAFICVGLLGEKYKKPAYASAD